MFFRVWQENDRFSLFSFKKISERNQKIGHQGGSKNCAYKEKQLSNKRRKPQNGTPSHYRFAAFKRTKMQEVIKTMLNTGKIDKSTIAFIILWFSFAWLYYTGRLADFQLTKRTSQRQTMSFR